MSNAVAVAHGEFGRAAIYALDRPIVTHAHREGHLVFHVDGPPAAMTVADQTYANVKDSIIAISPWEPHNFQNAPNSTSIYLVLYIKPMWFLENSNSAEFALSFGRCNMPVTKAVQTLVNRLTTLLLHEDMSAKFDNLLFSLTRACFDLSWQACDSMLMTKSAMRFNDYRVRRSLRVMQENLTEEFEMEELARAVGLSRPHFFKLFKQQMGVTPNIYMNTLKSEQAIEDLLTTDKSVTDIALELGFSSQASFTRFFSSNVGIAPSEYRRASCNAGVAFPMLGQ
ncbi:MAG: AraC family transcriptional regulator [Pseudomonadota bacterium]